LFDSKTADAGDPQGFAATRSPDMDCDACDAEYAKRMPEELY